MLQIGVPHTQREYIAPHLPISQKKINDVRPTLDVLQTTAESLGESSHGKGGAGGMLRGGVLIWCLPSSFDHRPRIPFETEHRPYS